MFLRFHPFAVLEFGEGERRTRRFGSDRGSGSWVAGGGAGQDVGDCGEGLVDGDGEDALFLFDDAGLEATAFAVDVVKEDAVFRAVGEPDAGEIAGAVEADAGGLDGGGEVHGAGIVAEKDGGALKDSGAFTGREGSAEVEGGLLGVLAPDLRGGFAELGFDGGSAEGEAVVGVEGGEAGEEGVPIVRLPIVGLVFGAEADGEEGGTGEWSEGFGGAGSLRRG